MAKSKPQVTAEPETGDQQQVEDSSDTVDGQAQAGGAASTDGPVVQGDERGDAGQDADERTEEREHNDAGGDAGELQEGHDADAPYGRKADGTPKKKVGRPPGVGNREKAAPGVVDTRAAQRDRLRSVTPSKARAKSPDAIAAPALAVVNYQAMGQAVASMFFSVGTLAFGTDWQPDESEGEPQAVAGAFRDYFKATNMRDLPPGFALCFVLGVYTLKRAAKPTMKSKLQLFGAWVKSKMPKRRGAGIYPIDSSQKSGLESL